MVGFLLRLFKQPSIVTYIIVGVLVGPFGFGLVTDESLITNLGSLGLILLLFFIGMEIHLPDLITNLQELKVLVLNKNNLAQFYICITKLTNLQQIYLEKNPIEKLPVEILNLKNLRRLRLNLKSNRESFEHKILKFLNRSNLLSILDRPEILWE